VWLCARVFFSLRWRWRQVHHTPWLQALDDSMDCYLADKPAGTAAVAKKPKTTDEAGGKK